MHTAAAFVLPTYLPVEQSRHHALERVASKCGHNIHPSASPRTPYCPTCVMASAKRKSEQALARLLENGGLLRPRDQRDSSWSRACLSYAIASRRMERVRKKDQLRWKREQAWNAAHLEADMTCVEYGQDAGSGCPAWVPGRGQLARDTETMAKDVAWWERLGAREPSTRPRTPPRSRNSRRRKDRNAPKGSPAFREYIQALRAEFAALVAEAQQIEQRYQTEAAVRRKHQLGNDTHFDKHFWDSPISGVITRKNYQEVKDYRRMSARRARGNRPPSRPPPSSLCICESLVELEIAGGEWEAMRERAEAEKREKFERKVRRVGEKVGYLYLVGTRDELERWREDYLRSNHRLVARSELQAGDPMEIDTDL